MVAIATRLISLRVRPLNCVSDTDAGPNLLREDIVEPVLVSSVLVGNKPQMRSTTNDKVEAVGTIML